MSSGKILGRVTSSSDAYSMPWRVRSVLIAIWTGAIIMVGAATSVRGAEGVFAVTASSVHSPEFAPGNVLDGNLKTRWASTSFKDHPEWLQIDFGASLPVESLIIHWERAYALEYELCTSEDAKTWTTIYACKNGHGDREVIKGLAGRGRYLRIVCLKSAGFGLVSIWEIEFPKGKIADAIARAQHQRETARLEAEAKQRQLMAVMLPKLGISQIIFAARATRPEHWYANFGYYANDESRDAYGAPGGRLYRLDVTTGHATVLLDDPQGAVRDPQVNYDGRRIIFSWRKGESRYYNLYEINSDGSGLKQLTGGPWDDIEPAYLPDGGIVFVSSRCKRWVNCWVTQVAVLHRCDADGSNIRQISSNIEHDNTPWVLPDGRILYTRWEYIDRSQVDYHHLWTMNPDGTDQMVYFGNMFPSTVMIDAKPIPGTDHVLTTFSPGHGRTEHAGSFYVVDPNGGPDNRGLTRRVGKMEGHDPYPLCDGWFLYAVAKHIRIENEAGEGCVLFTDPDFELHEPRPLAPRPREIVIPARSDLTQGTGRLILADAYAGRNMEGVKRGDIKKLLVLESLPKPINYTGGMDPLTYGGSFTLERVVGTVPVEEDGSAYIELPALRSFFFVAMDANNLSVKRMQSFLTVEPGETQGCVGCHEQRTNTAMPKDNLLALRRAPSKIEPLADIPQVMDFPRDIQPVLDRHCVACHDYDKHAEVAYGPRAGGVILTGDHGPMFSHSYATLTVLHQFADGRDLPRSNYAPRTLGTSASPLMKKLSGEHYGAKLSPHEADLVRYWIEVGAPYPGTYAALGGGSIGGYDTNKPVETDEAWPATIAASLAMQHRCASCHQKDLSLPQTLCDENGLSFWRPDWTDPRLIHSRHLAFNLSRPDKSLVLLAPLAKEAGGYGACVTKDSSGKTSPVFASVSDPDYQKILAMCQAGKQRLEQIKRFDMPGYAPPTPYVREMKRFGILPADTDGAKLSQSMYELDQRYWQSLWWKARDANQSSTSNAN